MPKDDTPAFVLAVATILPALAIIAVSFRFWARSQQKTRYGADDWSSLVALIFLIGIDVTLIISVQEHALAYPTKTLHQNLLTEKAEFAYEVIQPWAIGFTKLSFVFFYRRIFVTGGSKREAFSIATITTIVIIVAWMISFSFSFLLACAKDFSAQWSGTAELRKVCVNGLALQNGLAISDFLTDVIVFLLPIPMILRLHLPTGRKIAVLAIFGFGFVTVAISLVRMILYHNFTHMAPSEGKTVDPDLLITRGLYWGALEMGLGIITCCLPTLHSLLLKSSVQYIIRSIRSVITLNSLTSRTSDRTSNFQSLTEEPRSFNGYNGSHDAMVPPEVKPASIHVYAMGDMPVSRGDDDSTKGKIWVNRKFEQTENVV